MAFVNPDPSLISDKDLYIFDMDGTIYLGYNVFPFAVRFINNLRASGRRVLFFTNNASHTAEFYVKKLTKLGFSPTREEIMTSGDVTIEFLKRHRAGKSVYLVGTDELVEDFRAAGINMLTGEEERADIVITSFDTTLTYHKLDMACRLIRGGAEYLSTHPDFNCPTETGFIPDSGAIAAFVTASTGRKPVYFGKPYRETVEMIGEATGTPLDRMCIFGDRLYTDIAVGKRHGITAVLVYSGETTPEDVEAADPKERPDYAYPSLDDVDRIMFGKKVCRRGTSPAGRSEKA
ncbi:MAG: HAD-IIA family hydrolase [Clostridia bacterium]|nr:HAD-IIA family hydrolase [Clostridia bacterium]